MVIELLAAIGAFCVGAAAGQAAVWLWRSDLRLVLARKAKPAPEPINDDELITDDEFTIVDRWVKLNRWFIIDWALNTEAQEIHLALRNREPHLNLEANLAHVTAEMHRRHPEIVPTRQ